MTILATALAMASVISCNTPELIPEVLVYDDFSIINQDTVITRIEERFDEMKAQDPMMNLQLVVGDTIITYRKQVLPASPQRTPDLSQLKNHEDEELKGKPLRMMTIGGSLTAGVRDGGYFNEGIETAYPNLIARQMGIEFNQPYFDDQDYNGVGRKVLTGFNPTGGPVPKFKTLKNNNGISKVREYYSIKKSNVVDISNLAVPFTRNSVYDLNRVFMGVNRDLMYPTPYTDDSELYVERMFELKESTNEKVYNAKYDFYIIENGLNDVLNHVLTLGSNSRRRVSNPDAIKKDLSELNIFKDKDYLKAISAWNYDISNTYAFIIDASFKGSKGVILNMPNVLEFPYFYSLPLEKAKAIFDIAQQSFELPSETRSSVDHLFPNSKIDSLLSPKVNVALKPGINTHRPLSKFDFVSNSYTENFIKEHNEEKELLSEKFDIPVVDIYSLYEKILKGNYITDDGVRVDPSYPKGNFFSNDGIFPTAFGQAIIANEVIKVINKRYETSIELINTRELLQKF